VRKIEESVKPFKNEYNKNAATASSKGIVTTLELRIATSISSKTMSPKKISPLEYKSFTSLGLEEIKKAEKAVITSPIHIQPID
jgi:hypothetical protein